MRPYNGVPKLKQLPCTKKDYKGKNMSSGRKAVFSQSRAYHNGWGHAISWGWKKIEGYHFQPAPSTLP